MALLDLHLARSFVALVDAGSFTGGALALGISQPTVSQHVRRLEELTGERLLLRDTHAVRMTADGAVVYRLAREMIALDEQARAYFNGSADRSRIRLGVSEDLALTRLPIMLRQLAGGRQHVQIELTVGLTSMLYPRLDGGQLDLLLAKRRPGDDRGVLIRREALAWIGHRELTLPRTGAVPLVMYPSGSITAALAVMALDKAAIPWRIGCSSETLSGIWSGLQAGLGVSAQSPMLLDIPQAELRAFGEADGLPPLSTVDFVLLGRSRHLSGSTAVAAEAIEAAAANLWP